jgi:Arc/MetJ-type ribon-helix-helix transcriptional regulator
MKLSVSLPDEDVAFLDAFASSQGFATRSAVLHKAVRLLRGGEGGVV